MKRRLVPFTLAAFSLAMLGAPAWAQAGKDIRIALIASKTGPLEAYAKQTIVGFNMGLDYATGGTMMVAGRKLVVIEKDDQGKPDVGKAAASAALPTSGLPWSSFSITTSLRPATIMVPPVA